MSDLPVWQSHKRVKAAEIVRIDAVWRNALETGRPLHYRVTVKAADAHAGVQIIENVAVGVFAREVEERGTWDRCVGGYIVFYEDGHVSWSPKEAFEAGYRLVGLEDADGQHLGHKHADDRLE